MSLSKLLLLLSLSLPLGTGRPERGLHGASSSICWIALIVPDYPHRSGAPALWSSLRLSSGLTSEGPCPYSGSSRAGAVVQQGYNKSALNIFPMWFYFAASIQLGRPHSWSPAFAYYKPDWILEMAVLTCSRNSPNSHLPGHALFS